MMNTRCCFKTTDVDGQVLSQRERLDKKIFSLRITKTRADKMLYVHGN